LRKLKYFITERVGMKVPYNYLPMQFSDLEDIFSDWRDLIKTTEFTLGPAVEKFETEFADFIGCKHVVSTNNGTDALILALKACEVGPGDEVISVPTTFFASIGAIVAVGAKPVFVDIDDRYQIDVNQIQAAITAKTKAILPVHWAGASPNIQAIMDLAARFNLKVIEDACMAPGGSVNGVHSGTLGHASAWSMHPLKPLNVMGDGGMVSTNDDNLANWMRMYRNHGMIDRDHNRIWGVNMRLQPLQAIVGSRVLKTVHETVAIRNKNAAWFDNGLKNLTEFVTIPPRLNGYVETFSLYMAKFKKRNELLRYLNENGIDAKIHYRIPLHLQEAAKHLGYKVGDFPRSEIYGEEIMTLPVHQYLSELQLNFVIEKIENFYKQ
jgi:dTDP-3-amino-2,3,6-trideoxy-4-keto-D-glucose/dTDP-3-amino-3,4,6-trideoxy-alpha-D-glucose/dTDP-2,6-dideoxy-D-kanosamine transaminase